MSDEEWDRFLSSYRAWLSSYESECEKPFLDEKGEEIEGTMLIPMWNGRRLYLLMEYLDTFPERLPLEHDFRKNEE
jgi:hypothetical protein